MTGGSKKTVFKSKTVYVCFKWDSESTEAGPDEGLAGFCARVTGGFSCVFWNKLWTAELLE